MVFPSGDIAVRFSGSFYLSGFYGIRESEYGVTVQRGVVVNSENEIMSKAKELQDLTGTDGIVVKAQIHAGGRGKGNSRLGTLTMTLFRMLHW